MVDKRQPMDTVDPVDRAYKRLAARRWFVRGIVLYLLLIWIYWGVLAEVPVDYRDDTEHFLYGSIGSDADNGIPYWVWRVLPRIFPEHLPDPERFLQLPEAEQAGLAGYSQFGFIVEPGRDRPVGFSLRRDLVMRIGLNCAVCHTSTVRAETPLATSEYESQMRVLQARGSDETDRILILGMPANTVDLQAYFQFLFDCASDGRFSTRVLMSYIDDQTTLGPLERIFYKRAIPEVRSMLLLRKSQLNYFQNDSFPRMGPGRVDTFGPYKTIQFGYAYDGHIGTADFPSMWNQAPREGMHLHWDGNNKSVFERNISASIGAGATPVSLDMPRMLRVARWIGSPRPEAPAGTAGLGEWQRDDVNELEQPRYPFEVDEQLAQAGAVVYKRYCAACHDLTGDDVGQVVPINEIGTDPHRLDSYTRALAANQNTLGVGHWWRFQNFRKTDGYANMPLDGIWARAPYLHNGSVPTLRDLLKPPEQRPQHFFRGDDRFDPVDVGFESHREVSSDAELRAPDGRPLFPFDTRLPGNGNGGHDYGTDLSAADTDALIEYLKTL